MNYKLSKIASLIGAHVYGNIAAASQIDWFLTDSRSLAFPETSLFFALRTKQNDGHRYIPDLYQRGMRAFVVGKLPEDWENKYPEAAFLQVISPIKALQRLAERHREEYAIPVIGITGSNGKTMLKEWLYQVLSPTMNVTRSPRSFNSQIGVPLSLCLLNERTQVGIFEAGISQPGEMQSLADIIQPTIGVLTNIGAAHQENFSSLEEKCAEKLRLFHDSEVVICDGDDPVISECLRQTDLSGTLLAWSKKDREAPLYIRSIEKDENATKITYIWYQETEGSVVVPFITEAAITAAIHCLAVCLCLNLTTDEIARRMAELEPLAMRLEVKQGERNCTIINDSYNSDLLSLDIALDFMQRRPNPQGRNHTLILSDVEQSGLTVNEICKKVAQMITHRDVQKFVGVGEQWETLSAFVDIPVQTFENVEKLVESGLPESLHDEVILLKGSRRFGFERLCDLLSLKVHETILEVNLEAIAENLNFYRSFLKPTTKMVCMVKASAYGAGSIEIAKTLQDRGVDYLAVAVADEGAELRKAGITRNIIIMNPEMSAFNTMFEYRLEPEVYNFQLLEALIKAAERLGITNFPVHVKLDSGMHRLGFHPEKDMPALIERLQHQTALIPRSVFSHFVGSDSPDFDDFSREQFERFDRASKQLQQAFPHRILRHICNSAGIERFPERHLDMVRLGLGLYGIDPIDNRILHNVSTLKTTILQIREVPAGETVGYSRRGTVSRPSRIAALPIGYADGLNRHLGNRHAYCLVNGQRAEYVGNICMDVCMIDVTDINCKEGDSVEIFGNNLPVTVLSDILETIPYEVLTTVSERVKRVYYQG